jgi:hypothetical protein
MPHPPSPIEWLKKRLTDAIEAYDNERTRSSHSFVGQFADVEGAQSPQYGVYGMAAYATLCAELNISSPSAAARSSACLDKLADWVLNPASTTAHDGPKELQNIVPKICCAYRALKSTNEHRHKKAASVLAERIRRAAPRYPLVLQSNATSDKYATALVLNTFAGDAAFEHLVPNIRTTLLSWNHSATSGHPAFHYILDLFTLNAVVRSQRHLQSQDDKTPKEAKRRIKSTLAELYDTVRKDPFAVVDPIVLHFHEGYRIRYLRFIAHVCVFESLILISGPYTKYYAYSFGRGIWTRLLNALSQDGLLARDSCRDRMSFTTCLQIWDALSLTDA